MNPFISVIILSHNKPKYVIDAIKSVKYQTFKNWQATVWDSGVLYDEGYFEQEKPKKFLSDPRFELVRSDETPDIKKDRVIASWCFNKWLKNYAKGEWIVYLCDDDKFLPTAFADFAAYAEAHPEVEAMYGAADFIGETGSGSISSIMPWHIEAKEMKGKCCNGGQLFCRMDSIQICHRLSVLKHWESEEYWSEDLVNIRHADGVFLEKLGSFVPIYPIGTKIGINRKVPQSINDPTTYL